MAMRRWTVPRRRLDRTECELCGTDLGDVGEKSVVRKVLVGRAGSCNVRVIFVDGEEIHRCRSLGGARSDGPRDLAAQERREANRARDVADEGGPSEAARRRSAIDHGAKAARYEATASKMDAQDRPVGNEPGA
jgi:hypothetical protein